MEKILPTISAVLHFLAAVTWIGSLIYSQYAVTPALKPLGSNKAHAVNRPGHEEFFRLNMGQPGDTAGYRNLYNGRQVG